MAADSAKAATARVDKGIAPISDALQAQTAYNQAVLSRNKAQGAWQTAAGTLASDMDLSPDIPLELPAVTDGVQPDATFTQSVGELIEDARRDHPTVLAAQAQADAAAAKVDQTRAEGLPNISLVSKYTRDNQPASLGLGIPEFPATGHEWYVGVQVTIPFFEGFSRMYQVRQDQAQLEQQQDAVDDTRQQVGLEVWNSYQAVQTSTDSVMDSAALLILHSVRLSQPSTGTRPVWAISSNCSMRRPRWPTRNSSVCRRSPTGGRHGCGWPVASGGSVSQTCLDVQHTGNSRRCD